MQDNQLFDMEILTDELLTMTAISADFDQSESTGSDCTYTC
jgi:hypothetical protein